MTPKTIFYTFISVTYSGIIRSASYAKDANKYRDPQPDYIYRVRDVGTLSPKWVVKYYSIWDYGDFVGEIKKN